MSASLRPAPADREPLSDRLERWLAADGDHTLSSLMAAFGRQGFALLFVLLLAPSALPVPTGGATNVLEVLAVLAALQLVAGRDELWVPRRWRATQLGGPRQQRMIARLLRLLRALERRSRPRLRVLFHRRGSDQVFGVLVILLTAGAFLAPPFSGLDTLPSLGVVLLSFGVLLDDVLLAASGLVVGLTGIALEVVLGRAAIDAASDLL